MSVQTPSVQHDRRRFLIGAGVVAASSFLASCATKIGPADPLSPLPTPQQPQPLPEYESSSYAAMYGPVSDGGFNIPAIPFEKIDPRFYRQVVRNTTGQKAGTVVVDTRDHFLYYTLPNNQAMRYGVGLGRAGFEWSGQGVVQWKQKWPHWKPPAEMIARQPELEKYSVENGGMEPGLKNPLGARALYIFQNGEDTLYRLHGSPEWASIGRSVSSGCVRMMNQDVIDLYERVPNRTPIVVV